MYIICYTHSKYLFVEDDHVTHLQALHLRLTPVKAAENNMNCMLYGPPPPPCIQYVNGEGETWKEATRS